MDFSEPLLSSLLRRMPELETLEIMKLVNCPETFTLDMRCIMGESPSVRGYFVLAGMNSAGLSFGGGAGRFKMILQLHMLRRLWSPSPSTAQVVITSFQREEKSTNHLKQESSYSLSNPSNLQGEKMWRDVWKEDGKQTLGSAHLSDHGALTLPAPVLPWLSPL
ncbi:sarcosine dehydrogenase, mitochondrial-like isoform X3 [Kogia breviceps]|uniref:sarcosine dehydrogenase, mitochondrial-like isoform X3 n=2 Tax=Kogia breviceps TaxID=27615 RepID=UPI0034D1838A